MRMKAIAIRVFLMVSALIFAACSGASQGELVRNSYAPSATAVSFDMAVEEVAMEMESPRQALPAISEPSAEFNTEEYDRIYENEFLEALSNPLSTVSIDVDTASYSNARRYINDSLLPPQDAVRIEEFINYFNYDYPQPVDEHPFSINAEALRSTLES